MGNKSARRRRNDNRLEIFAQHVAAGKSPVEASKAAGYPPGSSFASNSRKRWHRADVRARVREIQAMGAKRAAVTIESLIEEAETARLKAMETGAAAAAVNAIICKAKLAGLNRERAYGPSQDLGQVRAY